MRVFICDDHKMFALALATVLTRHGHNATTFYEPSHLIEQADREPPDACLIDLNYGFSPNDHSGVEAIRTLSRNGCSGKLSPALVAMTGSFDATWANECDDAGAHAFVVKAVETADLERVLTRAVNERRFFVMTPFDERGSTGSLMAYLPSREISTLSEREKLVLDSLIRGEATPTLCANLAISRSTARTHVQHVLLKLGVHSRLAAVALARERGYEPSVSRL
jgi:two-component system, NarL family, nitrate/nitrite response regulator NarL